VSELAAYIQRAMEVWARLASYNAKKDFWTSAVLFVSKIGTTLEIPI
jgi:hypothetical protein